MITELVTNTVADAMCATRGSQFFDHPTKVRQKTLHEQLGPNYPSEVISYLSEVEGSVFAMDVSALAPRLAKRVSLFSEVDALRADKNGLFLVVATMIQKELLDFIDVADTRTYLGQWAHSFAGDNAEAQRRRRTLIREAQEFVAATLRVESISLQVATPLKKDEVRAMRENLSPEARNGIVSVTINRGLLGGLRMFRAGKVVDHSWRARLNRLFSN